MSPVSTGLTTGQLLLFIPTLALGLLGPGWLLGRALGTRAGAIGAFLGSIAILLNVVLALDALGLALNRANLALSLAIVSLILFGVAQAHKSRLAPPNLVPEKFSFTRGHWFLIPALVGLAAIAVKSTLHPLSGLDTKFRWDFLAREMFHEGSLRFYPPVSAEDFLHYPWCDGIAPLVSSIYQWAYLSLGLPVPEATAPIVIGQAMLLFAAVYGLARSRGGPNAGYAAVGVLATSSVLLSGIAIGQETGLTALSLVAMFLFIEKHREQGNASWLIWAGIAAGVGALAREYGIVFAALGALVLWRDHADRRGWISFLASAAVIMLPWYGRNWLKTGHPLFSHELGGLFPTNPIHMDHMRTIGELFKLTNNPDGRIFLLTLVATLTGVPIVLGLIGVFVRGRSLWPWATGFVMVTFLWLWSVHQTAGGYYYSLRVLTPAIAMASVFGGLLLAGMAESRKTWRAVAVLALPAIDAAQRTLFMPYDPAVKWWQCDLLAWRDHRPRVERWEADENWKIIADAAAARLILTNDPFTWTLLRERGARTVPIYSPAVRFLFEGESELTTSLARLREAGFRFVILSRPNFVATAQLEHMAFTRGLARHRPNVSISLGDVYDLYAPEFQRSSPAAPSGVPSPRH